MSSHMDQFKSAFPLEISRVVQTSLKKSKENKYYFIIKHTHIYILIKKIIMESSKKIMKTEEEENEVNK